MGFALLMLSHFSLISNENENLVSLRPNYFIFIGYLKMGGRVGNSLWIRHCRVNMVCQHFYSVFYPILGVGLELLTLNKIADVLPYMSKKGWSKHK